MKFTTGNTLLAAAVVAAATVFLVSCPMPTTVGSGPSAAIAEPQAMGATVEVDAARGLAVFVTEDGQRIDLVSEESDGGQAVCMEPFALMPAPAEFGATERGLRAGSSFSDVRGVVIGLLPDGSLGIWVVHRDGTVTGAELDGGITARMPACRDRDGLLQGRHGWIYHLSGWATDGTVTIVAGWAEHRRGFRHGPWSVDPDTTIGVYWKIWRGPRSRHVLLSPAMIIGTLDPDLPWRRPHRWPRWMDWRARLRLQELKLFLKGWYDAYLTMVDQDGVSWNETRGLFEVTGVDQDELPAVATIGLDGAITITLEEEKPDGQPLEMPDLFVKAVAVSKALVGTQDAWSVTATVENLGTVEATGAVVALRWSTGAALPASDSSVPPQSVTIAAGASADVEFSDVSIGEPGTHYVFVVADPGGAIAESNEANNWASTTIAITYPRLIIEAYAPTAGPGSVDTYVSLFDENGDPTLDTDPNLWNNNVYPFSVDLPPVSLAEDDDGGTYPFSLIDYQPPDGLAPGSSFYIRARGTTTGANGPYAIRALLAPDASYRLFDDYNASEEALVSDDNPPSGGKPSSPVTLTLGAANALNRYLTKGDVDWMVLTLP